MRSQRPPGERVPKSRVLWLLALGIPIATMGSAVTLLVDDEAFPTLAMPGFYVSSEAGERQSFVRRELLLDHPTKGQQTLLPNDFLGDSMSQSFAAPVFTVLDDELVPPSVAKWFLKRMGAIDETSCGGALSYRRLSFTLSEDGKIVLREIERSADLGVVSC